MKRLLGKRPNKKAFRYAIWSSLSRVMSVMLGAGAGAFLHQVLGGSVLSWSAIFLMGAFSYVTMFYAEYKKELDEE